MVERPQYWHWIPFTTTKGTNHANSTPASKEKWYNSHDKRIDGISEGRHFFSETMNLFFLWGFNKKRMQEENK